MTLTDHAVRRFADRFPDLALVDLEAEWSLAARHRLTKAERRQIRRQCPAHVDVTTRAFRGYYYKVSPKSKIAFVVTPPETIVTVFPLQTET